MKFKATTIAPAGRNEYGNYTSSGTVVRKMNQAMYYGDNSTGGNDGGGSTGGNNDDNKDDYTGFYVMLSKTTNSFDGQDVAISAVTDTTQVVGYRAMNRVQTYVMDLNSVTTTVGDDDTVTYTAPDNFGIKGLPSTGMTVSVSGNGTTGATISFKLESIVPTLKGEIQIPVCICKKATTEEFGDSLDNWMNYLDSIQIVWLTYAWELTTTSESSYTMDLTNDSATINADADGNVLTGATRPSCTATLFYGTLPATGVTYSFTTNVAYTGLTIEPASGILNFEDDFNFTGSPLEITISATLSGKTEPSGKKVMTITKVFPGADGDSVSRWLTTSVSAIRYNPNDSILNPTGVTAICWKQVNEEVPVVDTETTIYYGWDTSTPSETYTGAVAVIASKSYLAFGLKNTNGGYYELETIPILSDGENGKDGDKGESTYILTLTNDSASINADSKGNIISGFEPPKCTAKLYYGTQSVAVASYTLTTSATGVTIGSSTGVMAFASNFNFTGNTAEITVNAYVSGALQATKVMTISKSIAGADGTPGDSVEIQWSADGINWHSDYTAGDKYMRERTGNGEWSEAIKAVGENGDNGTDGHSPYVGDNGNWYFWDADTNAYKDSGLKAEGDDGHSPYVGTNGNWYEWDSTLGDYKDTGIPAEGVDGHSPYIGTNGNWYIWDTSANDYKDSGIAAKGDAGDNGHSPYVGDNGNWYVWDADKDKYVDSGIAAEGKNGNGVSIIFKMTGATPSTPTSTALIPEAEMTHSFTDATYKIGTPAYFRQVGNKIYPVAGISGVGTPGVTVTTSAGYVRANISANFKNDSDYIWVYSSGSTTERCGQVKVSGTDSAVFEGYFSTSATLVFHFSLASAATGDEFEIEVCGADTRIEGDWADNPPVGMPDSINYVCTGAFAESDGTYTCAKPSSNTNWEKIYFATAGDGQTLGLDLTASSELGYDALVVTALDLTDAQVLGITSATTVSSSLVKARLSGDNKAKLYIDVPSKGNHTLHIGYIKDGSGSGNTDTVSFKILDYTPLWMSKGTVENGAVTSWTKPVKVSATAGVDAVSYWLEMSAGSIIYNQNEATVTPNSLTAKAYKQIGANPAIEAPEAVLSYTYFSRTDNSESASHTYAGAVSVTTGDCVNYSKIRFYLKVNGNTYDFEDVDILKDGKDGEKGADGRQGAAVRGPVEWTKSLSNRRWCNGEYSEAYPEDGNWIDVIYYDEKIYRCITSYNGTASDTWDKVSSNWEEASEFNFVATNLLLAKNAYIEFLTNRGLYLRDSGNTITGGMQGGNGTNVWVGSDSPSTAPFKVDYDGTMTATKGKFGCLEVGSNDTYNYTYLKGSENDADGEKHFLNVNPLFLGLGGGYISGGTGVYPEESLENYREFVRISPYAADDIAGGNAAIMAMDNPFGSSSTVTMIQTNGVVEAYGGIRTKASGDAIKFELVSALPQTTDDNTLYFVY